ncbi:Mitochondrial inner membrane translocase subunit Tim17/Tim22/Tim23/peroxisomal protein PMP24 [Senna tora]|uniref:Mitochondrial inner membrane translocase subunit Tim17/Tim22/Tim23/peroxisomal protein PMP24 n=1 Tax=Senna tora TaxID=362788 RepID=A0A834XHL0_9FABA|nr:Mitochondrial inner membrane translocase subunit Tim17/Tim22/Tim23/peroxisomal protein PMP24 [Senna tora]
MGAEDREVPDGQIASASPSSVSSSHNWKNRVFIPVPVAAAIGAGVGLVSKHRKKLGLANVCASYAANYAIVTGCYCGAREFVIATRKTGPDDLWNSAIAGFGTGALLGRLQGGQLGAVRYSVMFAVVGTTVDYSILKLKPLLRDYVKSMYQNDENSQKSSSWLRMPEWFPIQVLDEEALAAKRAQEEQFLAQRARIRDLRKEES